MKPQDLDDQELELPDVRDIIKNLLLPQRYPLKIVVPGPRAKTIEELLWIINLTDEEILKKIKKAQQD